MGGMTLHVRRVYADPTPDDGYRVLVDRLWPRGLSKERAQVDRWLKEVAPSTALRTWFHHDHALFHEFVARYRAELDQNPAVDDLRAIVAEHQLVTLLYGAKDEQDNQAVVLRDYLVARG
ncbi:MAG: MarR family transcriptional regulator [Oerskovia sp.]|nr:MarR family transcriptional regulator [Oerskovia sp.]